MEFLIGFLVGGSLGALVMSLFAVNAYHRGAEDAGEAVRFADRSVANLERLAAAGAEGSR
jgi:hypothetical protein